MLTATPLSSGRARGSDPITSHLAAQQAGGMAERHKRMIVKCLRKFGSMGKDSIASHLPIDGVAVARRLSEMDGRMVEPTGKLVPSRSGRMEREWRVHPDYKEDTQ